MSRRTDTYITLSGSILADTGKAILFQLDKISGEPIEYAAGEQPKREWFPVSTLSKIFKDPNSTGEDWIMAAEWIAKKKELLDKVAQVKAVESEDPKINDTFDKFMGEDHDAPF